MRSHPVVGSATNCSGATVPRSLATYSREVLPDVLKSRFNSVSIRRKARRYSQSGLLNK